MGLVPQPLSLLRGLLASRRMPLLSGTANHNLRQKEGSKLSRHFAPILAIACLLVVSVTAASAGTGNGAPSGAHYNLNIIGVSKDKLSSPMTDTQRHTIFVPLWGNCPIALVVGDFQVNDGNCTDADGSAEFQLPNPDVNNTGTTTVQFGVDAICANKPTGYKFVFRTVDNPPNTQSHATVTCPSPKALLSGGTLSSAAVRLQPR